MGYSWVFLGDAELSEGARDAWLDSTADPALSVAALEAGPLRAFGLDGSSTTPTIRELFEDLESTEIGRVSIVGPITLRTLADKSGDAWLTWRANVVAAFVALQRFGGRGRLEVVGFDDGPDDGFRVEIDEGARIVLLDANEVGRVRESNAYREVAALAAADAEAAFQAVRDQPPVAPPPSSYLDHAMRTITERVFFDARDGLKRIERRILLAMRGAADSAEEIAARLNGSPPHVDPGHVAGVLEALVARRGANLALVERVDGRYQLTTIAAEVVASAGEAPSVLPMPVPWLLVAGGHAIAVGMECHVTPIDEGQVLAATLARLASSPVDIDQSWKAHVLVDGSPRALNAVELIDRFIAFRRETADDRTIAEQLTRWLSRR